MSKTKTTHPAAVAAANWWAQQIGAPTFRAVGPNDSAEDHDRMGMASMMATLVADKSPVSDDQGAAFAAALAEKLTDWLAGARRYICLGVDYGPDMDLAEVAEKAGVSLTRFPWKTNMWVEADHVTVSLGYQGPVRLVWAAEGWVRPVCASVDYDRATGKFLERQCGLPMYHDGGHGDWQPLTDLCDGCGLTQAGHYNRDRDGDYHSFRAAGVEA